MNTIHKEHINTFNYLPILKRSILIFNNHQELLINKIPSNDNNYTSVLPYHPFNNDIDTCNFTQKYVGAFKYYINNKLYNHLLFYKISNEKIENYEFIKLDKILSLMENAHVFDLFLKKLLKTILKNYNDFVQLQFPIGSLYFGHLDFITMDSITNDIFINSLELSTSKIINNYNNFIKTIIKQLYKNHLECDIVKLLITKIETIETIFNSIDNFNCDNKFILFFLLNDQIFNNSITKIIKANVVLSQFNKISPITSISNEFLFFDTIRQKYSMWKTIIDKYPISDNTFSRCTFEEIIDTYFVYVHIKNNINDFNSGIINNDNFLLIKQLDVNFIDDDINNSNCNNMLFLLSTKQYKLLKELITEDTIKYVNDKCMCLKNDIVNKLNSLHLNINLNEFDIFN
jgi:hypothetical protein